MNIKILVTGGTFDKEYNELNGSLFFKDSHVKEMFQLGRSLAEVDVRTLMMIDSLDMNDEDRESVLRNCQSCQQDKIVITHGTDNMEVTAKLLGENIQDKTIVLTGAMIPYTVFNSDALFNLGVDCNSYKIKNIIFC